MVARINYKAVNRASLHEEEDSINLKSSLGTSCFIPLDWMLKYTWKRLGILKMGDISQEKRSGCGLLNAVFGRRSIWPRRSTSTGSVQSLNPNNITRIPSSPISKRHKGGPNDAMFLDSSSNSHKQVDRIISRPLPNHSKSPPVHQAASQASYQKKKIPQESLGISGELDSMITDHQRSKGANALVRASSSNVMLMGDLGNLRQPGGNGDMNPSNHVFYGKCSVSSVNNVAVNKKEGSEKPAGSSPLCRALSTRMDPEELKIMGNEDYKNGRFAEALACYEAAISIDPNKASYRSNKSAALTALGRLLEAALECRQAIKIDPFYQRAHNRLATLYVRLGESEKAAYHFKQSGSEADPDFMTKAKRVQVHLNKCSEAKKLRDWSTLLKETEFAIAAGADSAPLIFGLKAEALLKMNRHQEAIETMGEGPNFEIGECIKFFGPIGSATLLLFHAQVDMAAGRFDEAVAAVERASALDTNNREANMILRQARVVVMARLNGNELFKARRFSEACVAYGEGLSHDPYNAVLLCNRAACRSKLGQFEKAIEDCSSALDVRAGYTKARLRRADLYAKMKNWAACLQDCEILMKENPDNEEAGEILKEAKAQLGKARD